MSMKQNHPFHMVEMSPWPLVGAISTMLMLLGTVNMFQHSNKLIMMMGTIMVMLTMMQWWRDVIREGTYQGLHTKIVMKGLRWGMILFIISEVFFFISFFWAFFHSSLSPIVQVGSIWPPMGINPFNPMQIPLLNTMILLSSGVSITWAHHSLLNNNMKEMNISLSITILMGMYFTILQAYEYIEAPFTISDSIYGSTFFMATGFHGLHVIIGSTFLMVCLIRQLNLHFSKYHHVGFEAAAWYWHFVDVVWLFLYITIYWWGN
uniref:Cytochrome c oxidase subunit 3 n=2 Tax=Phraortes TaxID=590989 RepID=E2RUR0_PHRIL|nr:cytochrome c oxidase subunit III [Phraortes illepidus]YP_010601343.1 cytochrome c oxidase subunit III [Phraortes lii]WAL35422.1 cytochrome c oxidase subunit III [Phraortes lii]BAJ24444.1 cytochrome c oxidase subunit III [Phraortes illepidus]